MKRLDYYAGVILIATAILISGHAIKAVNGEPHRAAIKVLAAQEFQLVDSKGRTRAVLKTEKGECSSLNFLDHKGNPQLTVSGNEDGGFISISSKNPSNAAILMASSSTTGSSLSLFGKIEKQAVMLESGSPTGDAHITVFDKLGNITHFPAYKPQASNTEGDDHAKGGLPVNMKSIVNISGDSTKKTVPFIVGSRWRIKWNTHGEGVFTVIVCSVKDNKPIDIVANVQGNSIDSSEQYASGEYYLEINSTQAYEIEVLSK